MLCACPMSSPPILVVSWQNNPITVTFPVCQLAKQSTHSHLSWFPAGITIQSQSPFLFASWQNILNNSLLSCLPAGSRRRSGLGGPQQGCESIHEMRPRSAILRLQQHAENTHHRRHRASSTEHQGTLVLHPPHPIPSHPNNLNASTHHQRHLDSGR